MSYLFERSVQLLKYFTSHPVDRDCRATSRALYWSIRRTRRMNWAAPYDIRVHRNAIDLLKLAHSNRYNRITKSCFALVCKGMQLPYLVIWSIIAHTRFDITYIYLTRRKREWEREREKGEGKGREIEFTSPAWVSPWNESISFVAWKKFSVNIYYLFND